MFEVLKQLMQDEAFKSEVKYSVIHFNPNEKILEEGKPHTNIYIVKNGSVRVFLFLPMGEKRPMQPAIADLGPGDVFGEFGLFEDAPASADVIAVTETELFEINIPSLRKFLEAHPDIGYKVVLNLIQSLVTRLRHSNKTVTKLLAWGMKIREDD